jgi:hypothetical protein
MDPATVPGFFAPMKGALVKLHAVWAAERRTPLSGCLRCVLDNVDIDAAIVGVNRLHELNEIEAAVARSAEENSEFEFPAVIDPIYLDPRRWPTTLQ